MGRAASATLAMLALGLAGCASPQRDPLGPSGPSTSQAVRIAILQLGSDSKSNGSRNLGIDIDADMIAKFRQALEAERPNVVIVDVNAEGGSIADSLQIARELEKIESEYRTVVWCKGAVTKAIFAVATLDEIYMRSQAYFGAAAYENGGWARIEMPFQEVMAAADQVSAAGHRDPLVMRSMIFPFALSAKRVGNETRWFGNETSGEILVNRENEILCFGADLASETGVSKGTADDLPSLLGLLGVDRYEIVAKGAAESFAREREARADLAQRLDEESVRCNALIRALAEMVSQKSMSASLFTEVHNDAIESLKKLDELVKKMPLIAHKLCIKQMEGAPPTAADRWFLPELQQGLEEIVRRANAENKALQIKGDATASTRVAVLELGQFDGERNSCIFGFDVDADTLATARRTLEAERADVVIVRVNAGVAELSECMRVANELETFDAQFRTVLLIDSAILNGALAVWSVDEIYMRPQANFGSAMVWWSRPITREYIDDLLMASDVVSTLGERDPRILRAMLVTGVPLSATRDGSKVEVFGDETSGEILINREQEMLTFNAMTAYNAGVSQGTADDVPSLLKLLGIENAEIVGGRANEDLQKVARERIAMIESIDRQTVQAWRLLEKAMQLASEPELDAEAFRIVCLKCDAVLRRLRAFAGGQPSMARYSFLAFVNGQERDANGSDGAIAEMSRILDAAKVKAAPLLTKTSKE